MVAMVERLWLAARWTSMSRPWPSGRMLALDAIGRGSIPGQVTPKT